MRLPAFSLLLATVFALANALPTKISRAASKCRAGDTVVTGSYNVENNLWNSGAASGGSQCFAVNGLNGNDISWSTTWTWGGGTHQVKSYANAAVNYFNTPINSASSIGTSWSWSYSRSDIVANVAYDIFTTNYEVLIWLAAYGGALPISNQRDPEGIPIPIAMLTIAGIQYKLYQGSNGPSTVFTFVASGQINNFNANIKDFFNYLIDREGFPSSQYLLSVGAGTEAFDGPETTFATSKYSVSVS